ncbi:MAG: hypothetical protein JW888_10975, partial [Pirellulales bacterium]|nr:hypothetical protein [Pirellulales bacterium]
RHPVFFKPQLHGKPVSQKQRDLMTSLVRRIGEVADREGTRRGRPLPIAVRVPDSVEFCKRIGLDVERWLDEGLIDMMVVSGYFRLNPWKTSVELGHRYHVPVFASLDEPRFRNKEFQNARRSIECQRARALDAWRSGVDGIYLFNYFHPTLPACNELDDPEALMTMDKLYTTGAREFRSARSWLAGAKECLNRPLCLPERPKTLSVDKPARVTLDVHDRVVQNGGTATLRLYTTGVGDAENLKVTLNGHRLGGAKQEGRWTQFAVKPSLVKTGKNTFAVSLNEPEKKKAVLSDLLLWIRYGK